MTFADLQCVHAATGPQLKERLRQPNTGTPAWTTDPAAVPPGRELLVCPRLGSSVMFNAAELLAADIDCASPSLDAKARRILTAKRKGGLRVAGHICRVGVRIAEYPDGFSASVVYDTDPVMVQVTLNDLNATINLPAGQLPRTAAAPVGPTQVGESELRIFRD